MPARTQHSLFTSSRSFLSSSKGFATVAPDQQQPSSPSASSLESRTPPYGKLLRNLHEVRCMVGMVFRQGFRVNGFRSQA